MGLDTTHDCWHGAYSSFHRWRCKLAELAGLPPLGEMEGFWNGDPKAPASEVGGIQLSLAVAADYCRRTGNIPTAETLESMQRRGPISWEALKPRPLLELLKHSDSDGEIPFELCDLLADDLETLLPALAKLDRDFGHIGDWVQKTQKFIDGLRRAFASGENVGFH